jgi:hypothetical protein
MIENASDQAFLFVVISVCLGACFVWAFWEIEEARTSTAAPRVRARRATLDSARPIATPEAIMRALATAAIANAFVRAFPTSSLRANLLKQTALLCGAVLFLGLLSLTYGLDLSAGFF